MYLVRVSLKNALRERYQATCSKIHQSEINIFDFESEFSFGTLENDSRHDHKGSTIANFQGFPLVLGGLTNSKLEMFDLLENIWIEKAQYPYTDQYVLIFFVVTYIMLLESTVTPLYQCHLVSCTLVGVIEIKEKC